MGRRGTPGAALHFQSCLDQGSFDLHRDMVGEIRWNCVADHLVAIVHIRVEEYEFASWYSVFCLRSSPLLTGLSTIFIGLLSCGRHDSA